MAYSETLADRVREYLYMVEGLKIQEKEMFSGIAFMVNGKMCVNVSGENLMCRFDPAREEELKERRGYEPMVMKGKELKGYCYVSPEGFKRKLDFEFWVNTCLDFNARAKSSKKLVRKRL